MKPRRASDPLRCTLILLFVALDMGSRRLFHVNVTSHPTSAWTLRQCREVLAMPHAYRFVLHDRDCIFAPWYDAAVIPTGVHVLRSPVQAPVANAYCERLLGSLRRGILRPGADEPETRSIPNGPRHLRRLFTRMQREESVRVYQVTLPPEYPGDMIDQGYLRKTPCLKCFPTRETSTSQHVIALRVVVVYPGDA